MGVGEEVDHRFSPPFPFPPRSHGPRIYNFFFRVGRYYDLSLAELQFCQHFMHFRFVNQSIDALMHFPANFTF